MMRILFRFFVVISFLFVAMLAYPSGFDIDALLRQAKWIWHPELNPQAANQFTYFRKVFEIPAEQNTIRPDGNHGFIYFAADANARLMVNGHVLRRKVTRYHPEYVMPEKVDVSKYLKPGKNVILVLHHNWGTINNFQRQPLRRAGLFIGTNSSLCKGFMTGASWQCAVAPEFTPHQQQIIGVIGDLRIRFPVIMDGGRIAEWLHDPDRVPPLDWVNAVEIEDGPWQINPRIYSPKAQREEFVPVQRLLAAGEIVYPAAFSYSPEDLRTDVNFPEYMEKAEYKVSRELTEKCAVLPGGEAIEITGNPGETQYLTFDFNLPVHGYPALECITETEDITLSLGYCELNVSPYDGTLHTDPVTGKIRTQGVVGTHYGDRYLTAGMGDIESIEIPDERTARYLSLHVTFPSTAPRNTKITIQKLGIVKSQYPIDWQGDFQCGEPIMDQIISLSKIHAEITMSDTYVDTPGREDGQWLEDIRLRARIAETWGGDYELRQLTLMHAEQCRVNGQFLSFAPQSFVEITGWDWGMQWIAMLYDHWKWTGGVQYSYFNMGRPYEFAHFSVAKKVPTVLSDYITLLLKNVNGKGLFCSNNVFADIRVGSHPKTNNDTSAIVHTWLIERLEQAIELAKVIRDKKHEADWTDARNQLIEGFNKHLVVREKGKTPYAADVLYAGENRLAGKSQAAQISAIHAGLFTAEERKAILEEFFPAPNGQAPEGIAPWNNPTYLYRALKVLSDNGYGDRAMAHLKWRMSPYLPGSPDNITPESLQGPLGGPLPEYFVTHQEMGLPVGEPCPAQPGDPTGSHGWNAVALVWLHDSLLGVSWEPGPMGIPGEFITIEPNACGLPYVKGNVVTPKGKLFVHWEPGRPYFEFEIRANVKVTVRLPEDTGFDPAMQPDPGSLKRGENIIPLGNQWKLKCENPGRIVILDSRTLVIRRGGKYEITQ